MPLLLLLLMAKVGEHKYMRIATQVATYYGQVPQSAKENKQWKWKHKTDLLKENNNI